MEICNQVILAGNLTDKPSVDTAGGRQFVRARLAQNWLYETQGKTVEHRQFLPLTFLVESAAAAKNFDKGDNIHITGQLIRRDSRTRMNAAEAPREIGTIWEVHVIRAFRISSGQRTDSIPIHQNEIRRSNDAKQIPAFLQESINDWPV
jgi:single-stranded DNA-binding protein